MVNPYGPRMLLFPFLLIGEASTYAIQEWQSPVFHGMAGFLRYLVLIIPALFLLASKTKASIRTHWYIFLLTFMALSSIRHTALLVLVGFLTVSLQVHVLLGRSWENIMKLLRSLFMKRRRWLFPVLLVGLMQVYVWMSVEPIAWTEYPGEALRFIEEQRLNTEEEVLLNDYGWGGYMLFSGHKVFIDGRADVYQGFINPKSQVMDDFLSIMKLDSVEELLEKYDCHYVLFKSDYALTQYLRLHPDWEVLFESQEENATLLGNR